MDTNFSSNAVVCMIWGKKLISLVFSYDRASQEGQAEQWGIQKPYNLENG